MVMYMLEVNHGGGEIHRYFLLPGETYTIGRKECRLSLPNGDASISRHHATITVSAMQRFAALDRRAEVEISLQDFSKHGTFVDRELVGKDTARFVYAEDRIRFGLRVSARVIPMHFIFAISPDMRDDALDEVIDAAVAIGALVVEDRVPSPADYYERRINCVGFLFVAEDKFEMDESMMEALGLGYTLVTPAYLNTLANALKDKETLMPTEFPHPVSPAPSSMALRSVHYRRPQQPFYSGAEFLTLGRPAVSRVFRAHSFFLAEGSIIAKYSGPIKAFGGTAVALEDHGAVTAALAEHLSEDATLIAVVTRPTYKTLSELVTTRGGGKGPFHTDHVDPLLRALLQLYRYCVCVIPEENVQVALYRDDTLELCRKSHASHLLRSREDGEGDMPPLETPSHAAKESTDGNHAAADEEKTEAAGAAAPDKSFHVIGRTSMPTLPTLLSENADGVDDIAGGEFENDAVQADAVEDTHAEQKEVPAADSVNEATQSEVPAEPKAAAESTDSGAASKAQPATFMFAPGEASSMEPADSPNTGSFSHNEASSFTGSLSQGTSVTTGGGAATSGTNANAPASTSGHFITAAGSTAPSSVNDAATGSSHPLADDGKEEEKKEKDEGEAASAVPAAAATEQPAPAAAAPAAAGTDASEKEKTAESETATKSPVAEAKQPERKAIDLPKTEKLNSSVKSRKDNAEPSSPSKKSSLRPTISTAAGPAVVATKREPSTPGTPSSSSKTKASASEPRAGMPPRRVTSAESSPKGTPISASSQPSSSAGSRLPAKNHPPRSTTESGVSKRSSAGVGGHHPHGTPGSSPSSSSTRRAAVPLEDYLETPANAELELDEDMMAARLRSSAQSAQAPSSTAAAKASEEKANPAAPAAKGDVTRLPASASPPPTAEKKAVVLHAATQARQRVEAVRLSDGGASSGGGSGKAGSGAPQRRSFSADADERLSGSMRTSDHVMGNSQGNFTPGIPPEDPSTPTMADPTRGASQRRGSVNRPPRITSSVPREVASVSLNRQDSKRGTRAESAVPASSKTTPRVSSSVPRTRIGGLELAAVSGSRKRHSPVPTPREHLLERSGSVPNVGGSRTRRSASNAMSGVYAPVSMGSVPPGQIPGLRASSMAMAGGSMGGSLSDGPLADSHLRHRCEEFMREFLDGFMSETDRLTRLITRQSYLDSASKDILESGVDRLHDFLQTMHESEREIAPMYSTEPTRKSCHEVRQKATYTLRKIRGAYTAVKAKVPPSLTRARDAISARPTSPKKLFRYNSVAPMSDPVYRRQSVKDY